MVLLVFKSCEHFHKCHSNLILNKAKRIDSVIAINSLSLAAFPLFIALPHAGKAAKLKLFIAIRESIYFALLRIKFEWHLHTSHMAAPWCINFLSQLTLDKHFFTAISCFGWDFKPFV